MNDPQQSQPVVNTPSKVCSVCHVDKPLTEFNKHRLRKDGFDSKCRKCNSQAGRRWYRRRQRESQRLYSTFVAMKGRCHNPNHDNYHLYGGRGITVCQEWRASFDAFKTWALDHGYQPALQLDRIDNDCGYCPENCRFVTPSENVRNRRKRTFVLRTNPRLKTENVREIKHLLREGISQREIGRRFGVSHSTIWAIHTGRTWTDVI